VVAAGALGSLIADYADDSNSEPEEVPNIGVKGGGLVMSRSRFHVPFFVMGLCPCGKTVDCQPGDCKCVN